jgi:sulfur carrier protein
MHPAGTKEIQIVVNGQVRQVPEGLSLALVLAHLEVASDRVAVELDRKIIRREDWSHTLVAPGMVLEVVQFVGGG